MGYVSIRSLIVIITTIIRASDDARPLLGIGANEVDLRIIKDFVVFVRRQFVHVELHHLKSKQSWLLIFVDDEGKLLQTLQSYHEVDGKPNAAFYLRGVMRLSTYVQFSIFGELLNVPNENKVIKLAICPFCSSQPYNLINILYD